MKRSYILLLILLSGLAANAQVKTGVLPTTPKKQNFVNVSPSVFENTLVAGKLTLLKVYTKEGASGSLVTYNLVSYEDPALLNNGQPVEIKLNQQSFENIFSKTNTALSSRSMALSKFIQDNKLSYSEEKDWIKLIKHYNSLK